jgi:hypothetical protein
VVWQRQFGDRVGEVGSGVRLEEGWVMVVWAEALNPRVRVGVEQSIGCEYKSRLHTILGGFDSNVVMSLRFSDAELALN